MVLYICLFQNIMFAFMPEDDFGIKLKASKKLKKNVLNTMLCLLFIIALKGRPHGRTRGYFISYFCTCTTFLASYTYKSKCVCTSTTSSNHVGFLYGVHVYDVQMYELAFFKWAYYHRWRLKSNGVLQDIHYKLFYILIFKRITHVNKAK